MWRAEILPAASEKSLCQKTFDGIEVSLISTPMKKIIRGVQKVLPRGRPRNSASEFDVTE